MKKIENLENLIIALQKTSEKNSIEILKDYNKIKDCLIPELQPIFQTLYEIKSLLVEAQLIQSPLFILSLLNLNKNTLNDLKLCFPIETLYWDEIILSSNSSTIKKALKIEKIINEGLSIFIRPIPLTNLHIIAGDTYYIKNDLKSFGCKFKKYNHPLYVFHKSHWTVTNDILPVVEDFLKKYKKYPLKYSILPII